MIRAIKTILFLLFSCYVMAAGQPSVHSQFTSNIEDTTPVNNITVVDGSSSELIFFSNINNCVGCLIKHQWFLNGEFQLEFETRPTHETYRWWSTVQPNGLTGVWKVDTIINGSVYGTQTVVYGAQNQRTAPTPVHKQMVDHTESNCEEKLAYFHTMTKEYPNDPYFAFMLQKWGDRCY